MEIHDRQVSDLAEKVIAAKTNHRVKRLFTVAISGIDASGKGYITKKLQKELERKGFKTANINIDPWHFPIPVRLQKENAAENFYRNVFRWNEFFEQLIIPFQENNSITLEVQGIRTVADYYYPLEYHYSGMDILLIEGIFLLKKEFITFFDYTIWIDCTFETGLKRAIQRNVEKLSRDKLIHDYEMVYYAAQRLHFKLDNPKDKVNFIFDNNEL